MTNIAFIPARGGSKSIPLKNIKSIMEKPLIYWTIKAAHDSPFIDKVVIATENEMIKKTVLSFGFDKVEIYDRDPANAQDDSPTEALLAEYVNRVKNAPDDLFFLLQATSPLTRTQDIDGIYTKMKKDRADSALSCVREKRFYWAACGRPLNYNYTKRPRRQNFAGTLMENGALYLTTIKNIIKNERILCEKISIYEMPSYTAVELDEEDDWIIVETLMRKYKKDENTAK